METFDNDKLFELACVGAKKLGDFLEATRPAFLTQELAGRREEAKIALAAVASCLLHEGARHGLLQEDQPLKELERFTTVEFLDNW
jgi:hypothetical protein